MKCYVDHLFYTELFLSLINTDFNKDQNHVHFIFIRVKTLTSAHSVLEATDFWQNLVWIFCQYNRIQSNPALQTPA